MKDETKLVRITTVKRLRGALEAYQEDTTLVIGGRITALVTEDVDVDELGEDERADELTDYPKVTQEVEAPSTTGEAGTWENVDEEFNRDLRHGLTYKELSEKYHISHGGIATRKRALGLL